MTIEGDMYQVIRDLPLIELNDTQQQIVHLLPLYASNLKALMEKEGCTAIELSFDWIG